MVTKMIDNVFWNVGRLDTQQYSSNQDKNTLYDLERQNNGKVKLLFFFHRMELILLMGIVFWQIKRGTGV